MAVSGDGKREKKEKVKTEEGGKHIRCGRISSSGCTGKKSAATVSGGLHMMAFLCSRVPVKRRETRANANTNRRLSQDVPPTFRTGDGDPPRAFPGPRRIYYVTIAGAGLHLI